MAGFGGRISRSLCGRLCVCTQTKFTTQNWLTCLSRSTYSTANEWARNQSRWIDTLTKYWAATKRERERERVDKLIKLFILNTASIWRVHRWEGEQLCPLIHAQALPTLESHYLEDKTKLCSVTTCYAKGHYAQFTPATNGPIIELWGAFAECACIWGLPAMFRRSSEWTWLAWNIQKCPLLHEARHEWQARVTW